MKLYFENSYGEEKVVAEVKNEEEAFKEIHKFLDEHNFKSYYTRSWVDPEGNNKIYDVGSWSERFILRFK